jgi:hypothetical protein
MFLLDDCYDDDGLGNWNSFILPSLQAFRVVVIFLSEMFMFIGAQHTSVTINHSSGARE